MRAVGNKPNTYEEDTGRMPTKALWDEIPWTSIEDGEHEGHVFWDDFTNMPAMTTGDLADTLYAAFGGSLGTTIQQAADDEHGVLAIVTDAGDEDEGSIQTGGNTGGSYEFVKLATAVPHTIAFEARVKKSLITSGCMFVGMGGEGMAANSMMVDATGAMINDDWIGFHVVSLATLTFSYKALNQDVQDLIATADTLVADTYVKVGFKYDYKNSNAKQIKVYVNGVILGTYVTKALIDAATFPSDVEMALTFGAKNITAVAGTYSMDWWKAALVVNG